MVVRKRGIELWPLNQNRIAVMGIATVALFAVFMVGAPFQNLSEEQNVENMVVEIPALNELNIDAGLTSITLNWSQSADNTNVVTYKVYMNNNLIEIVDGNVHSYSVTGLRAGSWYQFHVVACDVSNKCSTGGPLVSASTSTIQEATEDVIGKVNKLVSTRVLTTIQGDSLIKNLSSVYQLDQENSNIVINHLQAFITNANSLIIDGVLSPEAGESLINPIKEVIQNIKA